MEKARGVGRRSNLASEKNFYTLFYIPEKIKITFPVPEYLPDRHFYQS